MIPDLYNVTDTAVESLFGLGFVDNDDEIDMFSVIFLGVVLCLAFAHILGCGRVWIRLILCPRVTKRWEERTPDSAGPDLEEARRGHSSRSSSTFARLVETAREYLTCFSSAKISGTALSSVLPLSAASHKVIDRFHREMRAHAAPRLERLCGVGLLFVAVRTVYVRFVENEDDDAQDSLGYATLRQGMFVLETFLLLLVYYFLFRTTTSFVDCVANVVSAETSRTRSKVDDLLGSLLSEAAKKVLGVVYVIMTLQQLGLSVWAAIVGVGVLSILISFAAQEYVKCLFGLATLVVERPLDIGDFVTINGITGTVRDISLRYCHVECTNMCMYAIPNGYFLAGVVKNFSRRKRIYCKIEFDILEEDEGGESAIAGTPSSSSSRKSFDALRTEILCMMRARPEFVGGVAPSVRFALHGGSLRFTVEVYFLQTTKGNRKDEDKATDRPSKHRPKWGLFVEAEAALVLALRRVIRENGYRFASNPVHILRGATQGNLTRAAVPAAREYP